MAKKHADMASAFGKAHRDSKGGVANQMNAKMQKHCSTLAKDATKLADDAQKAAEFHHMRAKELQGK